MREYKKRLIDNILSEWLEAIGAVVIEGPKWCGKTTSAEQAAASKVLLANPDELHSFTQLLELNSEDALGQPAPMLIDEWQTVPKVWDYVRYAIDHRGGAGHFILTGSAVPNREGEHAILHTGTGRFAWLTMYPMSLYESGESTGEISLADLFAAPEKIYACNKLALRDIAYLACRGGWPESVGKSEKASLKIASAYLRAVTQEDVSRADGVKRSSQQVLRLMRSYARHQGTQASIDTICNDIAGNEASTLSTNAISAYLNALRNIFVVQDLPAWNPNLRSKTSIRSSNTRYFTDPSIATAALGVGPDELTKDLNTMGLLFETLCVRDLRVYASTMEGQLYHYRDKNGLECDAVMHLPNGDYGLIEIKLGGLTLIEEGAATLTALADKIDTTKMKSPAFRMVLTAVGDYAYRRPDGVYVVPIGTLRP